MSTAAKPVTSSQVSRRPSQSRSAIVAGARSGAWVVAPAPSWWATGPAPWIVALAAALVLAALVPLGLASAEAADQVAQALGARPVLPTGSPLAEVLVRWVTLLPAGEVGTRAHLIAAAASVTAVGLLVARVRSLPRPGLTLSPLVGLVLLILSRPFLEVAARHASTAVDLCLLAAIMVALESIRREPARSSAGLTLAFLCGLAGGAAWSLRAAAWPAAVIVTTLALRRGERWPLMAPTLFVAGLAITLAGAVSADASSSGVGRVMLRQIVWPALDGRVHAGDGRQIVAWIIDDVGALGLLVGAMGCAVSLLQAGRQAVLMFVIWGIAAAASFWMGDLLAARLFTVAGLLGPLVTAAQYFSNAFGKARAAVALVMLVVVVVPPAMVGVGSARDLPGRRNPAAVARGLDRRFESHSASSAALAPGEVAQTEPWRRYASAVSGIGAPE